MRILALLALLLDLRFKRIGASLGFQEVLGIAFGISNRDSFVGRAPIRTNFAATGEQAHREDAVNGEQYHPDFSRRFCNQHCERCERGKEGDCRDDRWHHRGEQERKPAADLRRSA
ncbi:MAG TPA: hypothetical protein PL193_07540 [Xanthobacteraceae bacterium]|nr:hypothetical protein [Xanthobacteraceae bacterium]